MSRRPAGATRNRPPAARRHVQHIAAAEFKAKCLELMDRVRENAAEYVVTKHGTPVARLVPYKKPKATGFFGSMKGTVLKYTRPFDPIDGEYDISQN